MKDDLEGERHDLEDYCIHGWGYYVFLIVLFVLAVWWVYPK